MIAVELRSGGMQDGLLMLPLGQMLSHPGERYSVSWPFLEVTMNGCRTSQLPPGCSHDHAFALAGAGLKNFITSDSGYNATHDADS